MSVETGTTGRFSRLRRPIVGQVSLLLAITALAAWAHRWYGDRHHFFDLGIYRSAMQWWAQGHPLYDFSQPDATQGHLGFTYPPFAAVVLRPLADLTWTQARVTFAIVSIVSLVAVVWWLIRPVADRHGIPRWLAFGVAAVLATGLEPIRESFTLGQVNLLLWALIGLDLLVLAPRGSRLTGVGIGLATAIKLIPGIFILYLLLTRRWVAAAVASGTAALATLLAFAVDPHDTWAYITTQLGDTSGVGQLSYFANQSVMGVLARLAAPDPPARWLWLVLAVPVLAYGMARAGRAGRHGDDVAGLALAGMVSSLISPVTWIHHLFWFLPALIVLADVALPNPGGPGRASLPVLSGLSRPRWAGVAAVVTYGTVTFSLVSLWQFTWNHPGGLTELVLGNWLTWVMLALLVTLPVRALTSASRPTPAPPTTAPPTTAPPTTAPATTTTAVPAA